MSGIWQAVENVNLTRREFISKSAAGVFAANAFAANIILSSCTRSNVDDSKDHTLSIFSWADYIHPDVPKLFEERYGIKLIYDTFASNEALLAKIQAGSASYDLIVPSSYTLSALKRKGVLMPLDIERLTNFKNLGKRFQNPAYDPHCKHSIPYSWGTTGMGLNTAAYGKVPDKVSLDMFWGETSKGNTFKADVFKDRMTLLDDSRETIGLSLKREGMSVNTRDKSNIELASKELKIQKKLLMCYTSDQVIVQLASGDSLLAHAFSGDVYQAKKDKPEIAYYIPEEGASLWTDCFCILKDAKHVDNAYRWINFLLEPEIAAANANFTRYASPNEKAYPLIDAQMRDDKNLYPNDEVMDRLEQLADLGEFMSVYDQYWTEIKCS